VDEEGQKVCTGCGTVISESNIVSEVTFGESSSGAAVVQGTFVGEDQTHVRSFGPGFQRGGGMESREMTEQNGNRFISQLSRALTIPESAMKAAGQVFKLAVGLNFIQGRRTKTVAAVCLYIACRRQDGNTVMLIDFADVLMINVFKLGRTYKALLDELRLGGNVFMMNPIDPESLIYRFAKQLEFGSLTMPVAGEAVRIVQRMNRDWMTTGRRPAGVCGAALILAARMNNFRRTIREVVYVVKVTEVTISQRLNEFSSTESGELTVDQFRSVQLENAHDPPSFTRARLGHKPSIAAGKLPETAAEIEYDSAAGSEAGSVQPRRVDADGFTIPNLPIDPALTENPVRRDSITKAVNEAIADAKQEGLEGKNNAKQPRNRPSLPVPSAEQIASEDALEEEMRNMLAKGSTMVENAALPPQTKVSDSTEITENEFEDDPEVAYCLLSPAEVDLKERVWVSANKEYLRTQQAKALKRALAEATGGASSSKPRKRRKGRMGDVGYLEDGQDGEGRSSRASTPAEATRRMLERRGYSKKINYSLLDTLYGGENVPEDQKTKMESFSRSQSRSMSRDIMARDTSRSRSRSRSRSVVSRRSASIPPEAASFRRAGQAIPAPAAKSGRSQAAAPPPTPPPTAPETATKDDTPKQDDRPAGAPPDPDDLEDDDDDDEMDDHVDDAFAGNYDDYYDQNSDYDYDSD
jgi:transcription factor IIIB subunit 2